MVNKYLKALALTIVLLAIGLVAINYFDNARADNIARSVEGRQLELQESEQLFLYESVFSGDDICKAIFARIESEKNESVKLLTSLESEEKNRLFPDSGLLKKKFILQNVEFYLLVTKAQKQCGLGEIKPVVYFYPDKYYCPECAAQAAILDSVVRACPKIRVFAFPSDLEVSVIDLLVSKYRIEKYPGLVLNGQKQSTPLSEQAIKQALACA